MSDDVDKLENCSIKSVLSEEQCVQQRDRLLRHVPDVVEAILIGTAATRPGAPVSSVGSCGLN